jgi:alpha-mannosidase
MQIRDVTEVALPAQRNGGKTITINVTRQPGYDGRLTAGYAKSLSGTSLQYHSFHPEAESALLLRAREGMNHISWQAEAEPGTKEFVLLCAIAGSRGGGHKFTLSADGVDLLGFESSSIGDRPFEKVEYLSGAKLRFEHRLTDDYDDHHGYLYLTLPEDIPLPGKEVSFSVKAEEAGSDDWFLLFEYGFKKLPKVQWEPVLLRVEQEPLQSLKLNYDNLFGPCGISIETPCENINLDLDKDEIVSQRIGMPVSDEGYELKVIYCQDGQEACSDSITIHPVTPRRVHILAFSHNDIGYTDFQANVLNKQFSNIRTAVSEKERTQDLPEEAQARWNLEVIWALEAWWDIAPQADKDNFLAAVRSGHIGLNALHNNLLSGLCTREELSHHLDFARRFSKETGIVIDTAAVTDIPGFVWALVEALYSAGVRFLALAPNNGDRVGHFYDMADKPFYWASPNGKAQVLTWIFGGGYAMFHRERLSTTGEKKMLGYLSRLQEDNYHYPLIPLAYTIGGDNGTPDPDLPVWVAAWNAKYASPQLVISTHRQFFHEFNASDAEDLPVLQGDLTPYWEDGAASTALETKLSRNAADRLLQTETLYRLFLPEKYPAKLLDEAWHKVIFWDEHTWGAWNSVSEPDSDFVRGQWEYKRQFALDADSLSREVLKGFLELDSSALSKDKLILYNTLSHSVEGMVILPDDVFSDDDAFLDEQGNRILKQILYNGRTALWTRFETGFQRKQIRILRYGDPSNTGQDTESASLDSPFLGLDADPETCSIATLRMKGDERELLCPQTRLAQYFYMLDKDREHLQTVSGGKIIHSGSGDVCAELLMGGNAPGCASYSVLLRLYTQQPQLDIEIRMDKLAVREPESVHIAFPFALEGGKLRYDGAGVLLEPEKDQLPGACKNFFCPEGLVDISNSAGGVSICLIDNPLIEIGGITAELPWLKSIEPANLFYAYLMNNYWHTNYKADQSGGVCFRFSLFFHGACPDADILRLSRQARESILCNYHV